MPTLARGVFIAKLVASKTLLPIKAQNPPLTIAELSGMQATACMLLLTGIVPVVPRATTIGE